MSVQNKLKQKVDIPVWEWLRFAPAASTTNSATCSSLDNRYIYYLAGSAFYRYDTISDGWQQLASPTWTVYNAMVCLKYSAFEGYRGNILGATSSTALVPGLKGALKGYKIRITDGTGKGQERTIVSENTSVYEFGTCTAISGGTLMTDSSKKWRINQWIGYQVRLVAGQGSSQVRKVLYNNETTLYFQDNNYQQLEPWNNNVFTSQAPYNQPYAGANQSETRFYIEASTITLDQDWNTIPDASSSFVVLSGGVWVISGGTANAPLYYYDVLSDVWTNKTLPASLSSASLGGDYTLESTGEESGAFLTNKTATAGGAKSLTDSALAMILNNYANFQLRIVGGTGMGQRRRIVSNTATQFFVHRPWDIQPDNTSQYEVYGDTELLTFISGNSCIYKYQIEKDIWSASQIADIGTVCSIAVSYKGQEPYAMSTGVRGAGGINAINASPGAGGTNYAIGDLLTVSGGTGGRVRVTSIGASGAVTGLELYTAGTGYSATTAATSGGTGTGCTVVISAVGVVGRVTLQTNHNLCQGDQVTVSGCTEAAWNTTYTILATDTLTTFDIAITATANAAQASAQATTLLVDASKNWTTNEHVGKIIAFQTAGTSPNMYFQKITANTATTITFATSSGTPANGTGRYLICEPQSFGRDLQYKMSGMGSYGHATGGSTTTLVDSTKTWNVNQWAGYKFRITSGTGEGSEIAITSNTATTLTYASQAFTPDATTDYLIMDMFGTATAGNSASITDTTKNWATNQWVGYRVRIAAGTGASYEVTITSNTNNQITFTGMTAAAGSMYTILGNQSVPGRGNNMKFLWIFNNSDPKTKGKYMLLSKDQYNILMDRYDITNDTIDYTLFVTPQSTSPGNGTMFAYDGGDRVYYMLNATGQVFSLDVNTLRIDAAGIHPYADGSVVQGNRMDVIKTEDGLRFLYIIRHSGQEFWRTLLFW